MVVPGPPADPRRHHRLLTTLLFLALAVPWVSAFFEWRYYTQATILLTRKPWAWGELPLVWVFYAKTQLLLAVGVAAGAVLVARGWWRSGLLAYVLWTFVVLLYVEVEKQIYTRTNVHLHEYAKFLAGPDAAQWAGNLHATRYLAQVALGETFQVAVWLLFGGVLGSAALWRYAAGRAAPRVLAGLAGGLAVAWCAVAPAQWAYRDRTSLQQLHALLPFNFRWSAPGVTFVDTEKFAGPMNAALADTFATAWPRLYAGVPADAGATFAGGPRPNVIFVVIESLRADALRPDVMPRLTELSRRGLRLTNHSAGAKISHYGLFGLLYARPGLAYYATVDHHVHPQACVSFKGSGYETHYVSSADHRGWMSMDEMASERTFDRMQLFLAGTWPAMDHRALKEAARLANEPGGKPKFITAFLVSTHFPYAYPDEFAKRSPVVKKDWIIVQMRKERDRIPLLNRYHNSCEFMDDVVADFVESIDLSRNLVVITGDHGESFWDDGVIAHGGRWSDVQWRVPAILIGAGVEPREFTRRTVHQDLLPTALHVAAGRPVPIRNVTGRDLMTDPPDSEFTILCSEATHDYAQFLLTRNEGRRLLMEMPRNRDEILVNASVDPMGVQDPFSVPAAEEAKDWGRGLSDIFNRLTDPAAPPGR